VRTCPFCAEPIQGAAVKCKHCGEAVIDDHWREFAEQYTRSTGKTRQDLWAGLSEEQRVHFGAVLAVLNLDPGGPESTSAPAQPSRRDELKLGCAVFLVGALLIGAAVESVGWSLVLALLLVALGAYGILRMKAHKPAGLTLLVTSSLLALAATGSIATHLQERAMAEAAEAAKQEKEAELEAAIDTNYQRATDALNDGDPVLAGRVLELVERVDSDYKETRELRNEIREQALEDEVGSALGDVRRSHAIYTELVELRPNNPEYRAHLADLRARLSAENEEQEPEPEPSGSSFEITRIDTRITERNSSWGRFAYRLTVRNNSSSPLLLDAEISFLDGDGFIINTANEYELPLGPNEERTFLGDTLVPEPGASRVESVSASVNKRR